MTSARTSPTMRTAPTAMQARTAMQAKRVAVPPRSGPARARPMPGTAERKLGGAREMIRRRAVPGKGTAAAGLPWEWERELEHEVAAQLRISLTAAGKLLHLAWTLEARLPRVGDALSEGRLDPGQAK